MDLNITRNRDPFSPVAVPVNPQGTDNFVKSIAALQDPSGTLQRMQAEQIMAGVKNINLDGLDQLTKQHALNAIDNYLNYSKDLYRQQKGLNRLSLNAQQTLDEGKAYAGLLTDINSLKGLSHDYSRTMDRVHSDVASGVMTPEDYKEFNDMLDKRIKGSTGAKDFPITSALYNNFLTEKGLPTDWIGQLSKILLPSIQAADKSVYTVKDPTTGRSYDVTTFDPVPLVTQIASQNPTIMKGLTDMFGGDIEKRDAWLNAMYGRNRKYMRGTDGALTDYQRYKIERDKEKDAQTTEENTIGRDADANGYSWDVSGLKKRPKWTGTGHTEDGTEIPLKNADVISIHSGNGKAWMTVQGQKPGDPKGETYILKVPFKRSVQKEIEDQGKSLDGWVEPLSGEHGKTVRPVGGVKHPLPAGKPRTVKQGGFTYTWNEQTGQYE